MKRSIIDTVLVVLGGTIVLAPWMYGIVYVLVTGHILAREDVNQVRIANPFDGSFKWINVAAGIIIIAVGVYLHLRSEREQKKIKL